MWAPTDWAKVFALAGLPYERFTSVTPQWNPAVYADQRMAWTGTVPGDSTIALRIEAASYRGKPVMFRHIYPWAIAAVPTSPTAAAVQDWLVAFIWAVFVGLLALAVVTARRNLRAGAADTASTVRMGLVAGAILMAEQFLSVHWTTLVSFMSDKLFMGIAYGSLLFLIVAVLYLTLEPIIRRTWPETLVSWVRLFDGRFKDARVGRDVMAGLVLSLASTLVLIGAQLLWTHLSGQPIPYGLIDTPAVQTDTVMGSRFVVATILRALLVALQGSLTATAILAGATALFKGRRMAALLATAAVMALQVFPFFDPSVPRIFAMVALLALSGFTLLRFGFLALVVFITVSNLLTNIPLVMPGSSWYATATVTGVGAVVLLAAWAFRGMLEGRDVATPAPLSGMGTGPGPGPGASPGASHPKTPPLSPSQTPTQPR
jgi:hypothetical protein